MQEILQILRVKIHSDWVLDEDVDLHTYAQVLVGRSDRDITTGVETAAQLAFEEWTEGSLLVGDRYFQQAFGLN